MAVTGWRRRCFLVFDTFYLVLGLFLTVYIFWTIGTNSQLQVDFGTGTTYFTYVVMSAGLFILLTGIFGFVAGWRESICMLKAYIAFLIILLLTEFSGGLAAYLLGDQVDNFRLSAWNDFNAETKNYIQSELLCCGYNTYTEYTTVITQLDVSCFAPGFSKTVPYLYTSGCWPKMYEWLTSMEGTVAWALFITGVALIQILCLVFAILVLYRIKKAYRVWSTLFRRPISETATAGRDYPRLHDNLYWRRKARRDRFRTPETPNSLKPEPASPTIRRGYVSHRSLPAPNPGAVRSYKGYRKKRQFYVNYPRDKGYDSDFLNHYRPRRY